MKLKFKSYTELNTAISPVPLPLWKYFQLGSAVEASRNKSDNPTIASHWNKFLLGKDQPKIDSPRIYKEFIDKITSNFQATKRMLSTDLECDITEEEWAEVLIRANAVSKDVITYVTSAQNCSGTS